MYENSDNCHRKAEYTEISHQLCKLSRTKPKKPEKRNAKKNYSQQAKTNNSFFTHRSLCLHVILEAHHAGCFSFVFQNVFKELFCFRLPSDAKPISENHGWCRSKLFSDEFQSTNYSAVAGSQTNPNCNRLSTARFLTDI